MSGTPPSGRIAALGHVAILVLAVVAASLGFAGVADADAPVCDAVTYAGEGTGASPYRVGNVDQLQCVGANHGDATSQSDALDSDYVLTSDIDASGTATWNAGDGFDPIGDSSLNSFTGTFDGRNHTIAGLTIDRPGQDYVGLFGYSYGTIEIVHLADVEVTGRDYTGGLVGQQSQAVTLRHVSVRGGTVSGERYVGGIAGGVQSDHVFQAVANVTVDGHGYTGGLIGESANSFVNESFAAGNVRVHSKEHYVGGLIGYQQTGKTTRSVATGDVSTNVTYVGGLVGYNQGGNVTETAAFGDVTGTTEVGGLIGAQGITAPSLVNDSYAVGNVTGENFTGGLVGVNSVSSGTAIIEKTYAAGDVDVSGTVSGGLVGENRDTVRDSYWNTETTGEPDPIGLTAGTSANLAGLTVSEMVGLAPPTTMDALDFANTWTFGPFFPPLQVQAPDLSIAVTSTNSPVVVGDTVEVKVEVTNHEDHPVSTSVVAWLDNSTANPTPTGTVPAGGSKTLTITNSSSGVDPGTYQFEMVTVNASSGPHDFTIEPATNGTGVDVSPEISGETDGTSGETGDGTGEQDGTNGEEESQDEGGGGETTAAVQTTQEGSQTQVEATVQNAQAGQPVEMQVSGDAAVDVDPETAPAQLSSVSVTPATDATFTLEVTESPEPLASSPEFDLGDGTTPMSYLSVEHTLSNADIEQATMTYRVSEQSLEAMESSPEDVSTYRYEGDSWVEQPTQVVGTEDGAAILQTTADGLSEWTAAAKRPRLNVTDTQVSVEAATTDEVVTIQVFVTNTGGTDGVYEAELLLNEETVDQTERTVPDGGTVAVNFERTFGQPGLYEVRVNEVFVGEVNISAAEESVAVETAANASIEAREPGNETGSDGGGGGGGVPVVPAGIVLVVAAGIGVWLYLTRVAG